MALQNSPNIYASRIQGHLQLSASTTSSAQLNLITGTAPTAPVAGDIWNDGTSIVSVNGIKIGTVAPVGANFAMDFRIIKTTVGGNVGAGIQNTSTTGYSQIRLGESDANTLYIAKAGSAAVSVITGTTIPFANASIFQAGGANNPMVFEGTPIYNIVGTTATNYGTRHDAAGFRIGQISVLHNANTVAFEVTTGNIMFANLAGTGSRFLEVDSSGNVTASAGSALNNASAKLFAYFNFS